MRRGDVVISASAGPYTNKPRPAIVVQSDDLVTPASVILCLITSEDVGAAIFRVPLEPGAPRGLVETSWAMVDKIVTVPREAVGKVIGRLPPEDVTRLNRALVLVLGIA